MSNIFFRYAGKTLVKNKRRTVVTIIGIILSMSMFTAVFELVYSAQQFLVNSEIASTGDFHYCFDDIDHSKAKELSSLIDVKKSSVWEQYGWAIDGDGEGSLILCMAGMDEHSPEMFPFQLTGGRFPESDREILLPELYMKYRAGSLKTGDRVTLGVGELDYESVSENEEPMPKILNEKEASYTVVGVYKYFPNYYSEEYEGLVAFTRANGSTATCTLFVSLRIPYFYKGFYEKYGNNGRCLPHRSLLRYYGKLSDTARVVLYGFAGFLAVLIAFGSVALIYNSFSISISDRKRQFGILRSVGATKKQIRSCVLYEALILSLIAIPLGIFVGCAGIAITLTALQKEIASLIASENGVPMVLVIHPLPLLLSAVLCMLTVLLSAWIPARKASKASAIDTLRQNDDIKIRPREVKTSRLTGKLFGFAGTMASKNFKRSRKRYRSVIFSLALSVVLFITASTYCSYLSDSVTDMLGDDGNSPDVICHIYDTNRSCDFDVTSMFERMLATDGVKDGTFTASEFKSIDFPRSALSDRYLSLFPYAKNEEYATVACHIVFVDDATFKEMLYKNRLNEKDYFDESAPACVIYDDVIQSIEVNGREGRYRYNLLKDGALPLSAGTTVYKLLDGYYSPYEDSGKVIYPPFDETQEALILAKEDAAVKLDIHIGARIGETLMALPQHTMALIYPHSAMQAVLSDAPASCDLHFNWELVFKTVDHKKVAEAFDAMKVEENLQFYVRDYAQEIENSRMAVTVINVFSYGFIVLISLICIANVFNTISTNVMLRRREFAMLKSVGMSERQFYRMMNYECLIYGIKGLLWGVPCAILLSYILYRIADGAFNNIFYIPVTAILIAIGSVIVVVFSTMLYATQKIRRDNVIDALKTETL